MKAQMYSVDLGLDCNIASVMVTFVPRCYQGFRQESNASHSSSFITTASWTMLFCATRSAADKRRLMNHIQPIETS